MNRLPKEAQILDLGAGSKSLFEEELGLDKNLVTAVDFSSAAILKAQEKSPIKYLEMDITTPEIFGCELYDLIFDSHCLHCITDKDKRKSAFKNIFNSLKPKGLAAFEMMVFPSGESFVLPGKYVVDARELELEILAYGFKIKYFMIVTNSFFESESIRCDLVRIILGK